MSCPYTLENLNISFSSFPEVLDAARGTKRTTDGADASGGSKKPRAKGKAKAKCQAKAKAKSAAKGAEDEAAGDAAGEPAEPAESAAPEENGGEVEAKPKRSSTDPELLKEDWKIKDCNLICIYKIKNIIYMQKEIKRLCVLTKLFSYRDVLVHTVRNQSFVKLEFRFLKVTSPRRSLSPSIQQMLLVVGCRFCQRLSCLSVLSVQHTLYLYG